MKFGHFDDKAKEYVITTPHTCLLYTSCIWTMDLTERADSTAKICRITEILYSGCGAHAGAYEQLKLENIIKYKANSFIKHIGNYRMIYGAVSLCIYVKRLLFIGQ